MARMDAYSLTRLDWDTVQDVSKFKGVGAAFADPSRIPTRRQVRVHARGGPGSRVVPRGSSLQEAKRARSAARRRTDDDDGEERRRRRTGPPGAEELSAKKLAADGLRRIGRRQEEAGGQGQGQEASGEEEVIPRQWRWG